MNKERKQEAERTGRLTAFCFVPSAFSSFIPPPSSLIPALRARFRWFALTGLFRGVRPDGRLRPPGLWHVAADDRRVRLCENVESDSPSARRDFRRES